MYTDYLPEQAMLVANNTFCFCFFFFLPELDPLSPEMLFNERRGFQLYCNWYLSLLLVWKQNFEHHSLIIFYDMFQTSSCRNCNKIDGRVKYLDHLSGLLH